MFTHVRSFVNDKAATVLIHVLANIWLSFYLLIPFTSETTGAKMLKAEFEEYGEPLILKEIEIPKPPPKGFIVKNHFAGICHSDIHHWEDDFDMGRKRLPLVLGHEIAGTIHSLGGEIDEGADPSLKVGDRVAIYPWIGCADCQICKGPSPHACGKPTYRMGIQVAGGYATYTSVVAKRYAIKLADNLPLDVACMLPCSALTTYNAVSKARTVLEEFYEARGSATLLVIGAGGLGLWCLQNARAVLPPNVKILSADISEEKLTSSKSMGADDTVVWELGISDEEAKKRAIEKAGGSSIDAVIDVVGATATIRRALGIVSKTGIVVPVGLFGGDLNIRIESLVFRSVTLAGINVGSLPQLKAVIKLCEAGKIKSPPYTCFDLKDATKVLKDLKDGKIKGRALFKY